MSHYLENLNPQQKQAVENYQSAALIIAGAGSGKTRVITSRIAYMLENSVDPYRVMALTFTNKAAEEMRERIAEVVTPAIAKKLWMGTFHSIFARILRNEAERIGYTSSFTIYDPSDCKSLIRQIIKQMNLNDDAYKPERCLNRISQAKNNLVTPQAYAANSQAITVDRDQKIPQLFEIYRIYAARCKELGAMDFDDLLLNVCILFRDNPDVLERYQKHFQYLLVDEYQDTNYAQYYIVKQLSALHGKICVVGDDAQSIYSFRGAKIENILRFQKDFPQAQVFKLEQNYRSTQTIVDAANSIIKRNERQIKKECFSQGGKGEKIKVVQGYTDGEEASIIADMLRGWAREGTEWNKMAILYRTNSQSRVLEEHLIRRSIPYKVHKGTSFYTRKEIKDTLAYFRLIDNRKDDESFKRVVNYPARGLGDVTIAKIENHAKATGLSMFEAAKGGDYAAMELKGATELKLKEFVRLIDNLDELRLGMRLYDFGLEVASRSGILTTLKAKNLPENDSAIENIEELLSSMESFSQSEITKDEYDPQSGELMQSVAIDPTLNAWLSNIALLSDINSKDDNDDKVTLMTVHSAKGLEYDHVVIAGLEENLFPSIMSFGTPEGLEEERRLFYVALTRAKISAVLSFASSRFVHGKSEFHSPSRFLSEIDPQYLDIDIELDQAPQQRQQGHKPLYNKERKKINFKEDILTPTPPKRFIKMTPTPQPNTPSSAPSSPAQEYRNGMRVEHSKFGQGTIVAFEETFSDVKLTIDFDEWSQKVLLAKFAKLSIVE